MPAAENLALDLVVSLISYLIMQLHYFMMHHPSRERFGVQVFLPELPGFPVQKSLWSITISDKPIQSLSLEAILVDASGIEANRLPILPVFLDFSNLSAYSPEYCELDVFL